MKKLFMLSLVLVASTLSAATITLNCPQLVVSGSSGSGTENCNPGFVLPGGVTSADITSITITTVFDFQFNPINVPTASASYQFAMPNGVNITGSVTNAGRPDVKNTSLCSGAGCNVYLAAFTINDSFTGTSNVTGGTFDKVLTLTYADGVPEPATIGLVGMALIGLGLSRRRS